MPIEIARLKLQLAERVGRSNFNLISIFYQRRIGNTGH